MPGRATYQRLRERAAEIGDALPWVRRLVTDFRRIELIDRSTALGAQMLLALIPMMMSLGVLAPSEWGKDLLAQLDGAFGVSPSSLEPLSDAMESATPSRAETGYLSLVVGFLSASSFSRAMQRMYARAWDLPKSPGLRAVGVSILWLVGWVVVLQAATVLIRAVVGVPLTGAVQLSLLMLMHLLLWWWSAHLLLDRRVPWLRLLPGAVITAVLVVLLSQASPLFMPAFARANLEQFGPLGVVFSVGSWLVVFGGVLVTSTVLGRLVSDLLVADRTAAAAATTPDPP